MKLIPIVDAHHHLWDLKAVDYPWLNEKGKERFFGNPEPIQKNYLAEDFATDIQDLPVVKSVHIQVGAADPLRETLWVDHVCKQGTGRPAAIVAYANLTSPKLANDLEALAAADCLRGVRQIVGRSAKEDAETKSSDLLVDPKFKEGLRLLASMGLSFDLQLTPPQMAASAEVLRDVPCLKTALCHAGSLQDFSKDGIAQWREGLSLLAQLPSALCKISGFGMFDHHWTPASVTDPIRTVIDIFSPQRVAFGSNFPVDKLYSSYRRIWEAYVIATEPYNDAERRAMFAENAEAFYRI